ncbi:hypothetical protein F0P96_16390 [Hymenobacter busanensis]|uniref:Uncharacterized protein n=1 Tax=Hymenobacter busanensis TaxID=2607656 RepID=A0A7L4ZT53_9BACT|nr:hypothetical protein [Hymenobacter busanensis]KAA9327559.1 hypothetical protein F0P96_16390 [Hymenobacter busanensis]QHJ06103.1 hypothetical protein GUY19_01845 [Hymenobacter busanensis]
MTLILFLPQAADSKKRLLWLGHLLLLLLAATAGFAQSKPLDDAGRRQRLKTQVNAMGTAFVKHDYASFVRFMHPDMVKMAGGPQAMAEELRKGITGMEGQGMKVRGVRYGEPSAVISTNNGELQCTVPQITDMQLPSGGTTVKSTLIAFSADKGQNWYFLDTSGKDADTVRQAFPQVSKALKYSVAK